MQRFHPFPYVVGLGASDAGDTVFEILTREISTVTFDPEEGWYRTSGPAGAFEIFDVQPGDPRPVDSPFGGELIGFLGLDPWEQDVFEWIVERALYAGQGFVIDRRSDTRFDLAIKKTKTIREIVNRHGFSEGAELLESTDAYFHHVRNAIASSLATVGLRPFSYHAGDHPHILDGFEGDDASRSENWKTFEEHADRLTVEIWVADFEGLRDWFETRPDRH